MNTLARERGRERESEREREREKFINRPPSPTESNTDMKYTITIIYETYARELNGLACVPIVNQKHLH